MNNEEIEGAISLLAQRLHNVETAMVKLIDTVAREPVEGYMFETYEPILAEFFECSESLGAFEREGWFAAEDEE